VTLIKNQAHAVASAGSTKLSWSAALAFTFQIYFDFSGYSDMALGLMRLFGFRILENFNYPYISRSIREFWRRWHMTLSRFLRDYLFIWLWG
jgi:alginate O-acetyltransferase complex protein AlgI